jgi:hypothetical protein
MKYGTVFPMIPGASRLFSCCCFTICAGLLNRQLVIVLECPPGAAGVTVVANIAAWDYQFVLRCSQTCILLRTLLLPADWRAGEQAGNSPLTTKRAAAPPPHFYQSPEVSMKVMKGAHVDVFVGYVSTLTGMHHKGVAR